MTFKELILKILFLTVLVVGGFVLICVYAHWAVALGVFFLIWSSKFKIEIEDGRRNENRTHKV